MNMSNIYEQAYIACGVRLDSFGSHVAYIVWMNIPRSADTICKSSPSSLSSTSIQKNCSKTRMKESQTTGRFQLQLHLHHFYAQVMAPGRTTCPAGRNRGRHNPAEFASRPQMFPHRRRFILHTANNATFLLCGGSLPGARHEQA